MTYLCTSFVALTVNMKNTKNLYAKADNSRYAVDCGGKPINAVRKDCIIFHAIYFKVGYLVEYTLIKNT